MILEDIVIPNTEDSKTQFKLKINSSESLASEIAAFANCEGGTIYIGVADDGTTPGITRTEVSNINQLISNAASHLIRSPLTVYTKNLDIGNDLFIIVLTVPKGLDKPYFDKNGTIWLKCGADKRKINSKDELRRYFQNIGQFHSEQMPANVGVEAIDKLRFRDFIKKIYNKEFPNSDIKLLQLLRNMGLATEDGHLNLAGVLLFAEAPENIFPQFMMKAIRYPGNEIHIDSYLDTEDFEGPIQKIFQDSMEFIRRNLHKVQAGQGVNSLGIPEIPLEVFEELLVNALTHRDYTVSSMIRIFIYANRIEIISPGHLPDSLTVEEMLTGQSKFRNPIIIKHVARGLLPYRGIGSGIKRALDAWQDIEFKDDRKGCLFTAIVHRKPLEQNGGESSVQSSVESSGEITDKTSIAILQLLQESPKITIVQISNKLQISERAIYKQIAKLKLLGKLVRIGPTKNGSWRVIENN